MERKSNNQYRYGEVDEEGVNMENQEEYKVDIKAKQREIINHYGFDHQLERLMEECGELIVAIAKNKRYAFSDTCIDHYENLVEELADVKNLIEQLEIDNDYVREGIEVMIGHKVNRELERIRA